MRELARKRMSLSNLGASAGCLLLLAGGCATLQPEAPPPPPTDVEAPAVAAPMVRVALSVQIPEVHIGSDDSFSLVDDAGVLAVGLNTEVFNIRRERDRVLVFTQGGELMDTVEGTLKAEPRSESGEIKVNGARYPSRIEIVPSPQGGLNVINVVDVETYLRAVVPLEIGHDDEAYLAAATAQAVAARTYVAGHLNQYPEEHFDLFSGVTDQVYGSVDRRHPITDRAVAATRGLVLLYGGRPIRANYSSTCGGKTAGVEESFDADPLPYLKSHDDKVDGNVACRLSSHYRWKESWTGAELERVLSRTVPRVLEKPWKARWVLDVEAAETGKSGRIVRLRITTDQGVYEVDKGAIRQVLETTSGKPLRSTAFEIDVWKKGERIRMMVARGRGWGHGVGMCQWGAMQMSKDGYEYDEILHHYYPGAKLEPWSPSAAFSRDSSGHARGDGTDG